ASRAANGGCSVSLRSKDVVEVRWARQAVITPRRLAVSGGELCTLLRRETHTGRHFHARERAHARSRFA
ncbi:hypothetical protein, partial [Nocardia asiatica]